MGGYKRNDPPHLSPWGRHSHVKQTLLIHRGEARVARTAWRQKFGVLNKKILAAGPHVIAGSHK